MDEAEGDACLPAAEEKNTSFPHQPHTLSLTPSATSLILAFENLWRWAAAGKGHFFPLSLKTEQQFQRRGGAEWIVGISIAVVEERLFCRGWRPTPLQGQAEEIVGRSEGVGKGEEEGKGDLRALRRRRRRKE